MKNVHTLPSSLIALCLKLKGIVQSVIVVHNVPAPNTTEMVTVSAKLGSLACHKMCDLMFSSSKKRIYWIIKTRKNK